MKLTEISEIDRQYQLWLLKEAYRQLLHGPEVIDECMRRFERTFRHREGYICVLLKGFEANR